MSHRGVWVFLPALTLLVHLARAQPAGPRPLPDNPAPQFPNTAIADAVTGCVELSVTVKPDGKPGSVRIVKAAPSGFGFEKAVRDAVARWRFEPPAGSGGAATYTNKYAFSPGPVPISFWQRAPGARVSLVSGQTVQLTRGWVRTRRWFSDFVLDVEFRLMEERTAAGILVHAQPVGQDDDRLAYRVNLANDMSAPAMLGRIDGGDLTFREVSFNQSAAAAAVRPAGEWQTVRVEVTNGAARVTANGVPISMSDEFVRRTGHIGLEVTRGSIEVRRATVERRDTYLDCSGPRPAGESALSPQITSPRVRTEVKPDYSVEAMKNRKEGMVTMDAVVLPDGSVGPVRVIKSLDLDLDQAAVATIRRWQFHPGLKDGEAVPVEIVVEMSFSLR